jgi:cysteine-rich repeat protein
MRPQLSTVIVAVLAIALLAYIINPTGLSSAFSIQPPEEQQIGQPAIEEQLPIDQLIFQAIQPAEVQEFTPQATGNFTDLSNLSGTAFVNPEGKGDVLIFPYWNVRSQQAYFSIVNTDVNNGVIAKLRFETKNPSRYGYVEFFVYLSANDVLDFIVQDSGGYALFLPQLPYDNEYAFITGYTNATKTFTLSQFVPMPFPGPLGSGNWTSDETREESLTVIAVEKAPATRTSPTTVQRIYPYADALNKLIGALYLLDMSTSATRTYSADAIANFYTNGTLFGYRSPATNNTYDACLNGFYPGPAQGEISTPTTCEPYLLNNTVHNTNDNQTKFALSKKNIYAPYEVVAPSAGMTNLLSFIPFSYINSHFFADFYDDNETGTVYSKYLNFTPSLGSVNNMDIFASSLRYPIGSPYQAGWTRLNFSEYSQTGNFDFFGNSYSNYKGIPISGLEAQQFMMSFSSFFPYSYEKNWEENSLYLNPGKTGDALICAYFDANGIMPSGTVNAIKIVNTNPDKGIMYKLRLRAAGSSHVILENDFWLSANDVNTLNVQRSSPSDLQLYVTSGDKIVNSCNSTACVLMPGGGPITYSVPPDSFEGYIEIIAVEATAPTANPPGTSVNRTNGTAADAPNSLQASISTINIGANEMYAYWCDALANFYTNGTLFESLSSPPPVPISSASEIDIAAAPPVFTYGPYLDDAQEGLSKVELALSKKEITFPYDTSSGLGGRTKLIYTFPTKHFHYNNTTGALIPRIDNPFYQTTNSTPQNYFLDIYDALENNSTLTNPFVNETNSLLISDYRPDGMGWAKVRFVDNHVASPANSTSWNYLGTTTVQNYTGLPATAIVIQSYFGDNSRDAFTPGYEMGLIGTVVPPGPVCGNSIIETGEECDDGNTISGDGCSASCQTEGGGGRRGGGGATIVPSQPSQIPLEPTFAVIEPGEFFDITLSFGESFSFYVAGQTHSIALSGIIDSVYTFTLFSEPIKVASQVGETKQVDVNGDGTNDIEITLLSAASDNSARIRIRSLAEVIKVPTPTPPTIQQPAPTPMQLPFSLPNLIILALAVLLIVSIAKNYMHRTEKKYWGEEKMYRFVSRALDEGHVESYIFQRLMDAGWKHEQIDRALKKAKRKL